MSKFFVSCPCGCGEAVEASDAGFSATTVRVNCCERSELARVTVRKSWAYANAVPTTGVAHRDGSVVFG